LRQEAAERQMMNVQEEVRRLRDEVYEAERLASEASAAGDRETALSYAEWANSAEQNYLAAASQLPQPGPQVDPRLLEFVQKNQSFFDKYGQAGVQGFELAHQYATRPRNPTSNNPQTTGMGLTFGSKEYFSAVRDLMQMYGPSHGLNFDPGDELITPDEAAKIGGISAKEYNRGVQRMLNEGKDSATEYGAQWNREVG
jgi:hypothetical protein